MGMIHRMTARDGKWCSCGAELELNDVAEHIEVQNQNEFNRVSIELIKSAKRRDAERSYDLACDLELLAEAMGLK